jgi:hypothetical protein
MAKKIWFSDLATVIGVPDRTLRQAWRAFCVEYCLTLTPRQANAKYQELFFGWLHQQADQDHDAQAPPAAARARRQQQVACAKAVTALEQLIATYGFDAVLTEVVEVICAPRGRLVFRPFPRDPHAP